MGFFSVLLLALAVVSMAQTDRQITSVTTQPSAITGARIAGASKVNGQKTRITPDEAYLWYVWDSATDCATAACKPALYSQNLPASSASTAKQLSVTPSNTGAQGKVFDTAILSPNGQYILYEGELSTSGQQVVNSVPINGPSSSSVSVFPTAQIVTAGNSAAGARLPPVGFYNNRALFTAATVANSSTSELWTASIVTGGPVKVAGVTDGAQSIVVRNACPSGIYFTRNSGAGVAPRSLFVATWDASANPSQVSSTGNTNNAAGPSALTWSPNGNWFAFTEVTDNTNNVLYAYSVTARTLYTVFTTQSGTGIIGEYSWTPDSSKIVIRAKQVSTDNFHAWVYSTGTPSTAARKLSPTLDAADNVVSVIGNNNYAVFQTSGVGSTIAPGLWSGNLNTATAAAQLNPTINTNFTGGNLIAGATIVQGGAYVAFLAATTSSQRNLFSTPIGGGTPVQLNPTLVATTGGTVSVGSVNIVPSGGTDYAVYTAQTAVNGAVVTINAFSTAVNAASNAAAIQLHPAQQTSASTTASFAPWTQPVVPVNTPFTRDTTTDVTCVGTWIGQGPWINGVAVTNPGVGSASIVYVLAFTGSVTAPTLYAASVASNSNRAVSGGASALTVGGLLGVINLDRTRSILYFTPAPTGNVRLFATYVDGSLPSGSNEAVQVSPSPAAATITPQQLQFTSSNVGIFAMIDAAFAARARPYAFASSFPITLVDVTPSCPLCSAGANDPILTITDQRQTSTPAGVVITSKMFVPYPVPAGAQLFSTGLASANVYVNLIDTVNQTKRIVDYQVFSNSFKTFIVQAPDLAAASGTGYYGSALASVVSVPVAALLAILLSVVLAM